ncbi:MAG: hypothetical protein EOM90_17120, partial [Alphaproteobacteria bacterium]|nr:hypothetical protein [Alphaproteobacteria bacterium]
MKKSLLFVLPLVFITLFSRAQITPVYVDGTHGNDSWDGSSLTYVSGSIGPKATIQAGVAAVSAGGVINVVTGTYNEKVDINVVNCKLVSISGAISTVIHAPTTGGALPTVEFLADGITLEGFTIDNDGGTQVAIAPRSSSGATIKDNLIANSARGIQGDYYGVPVNLTITGNTFDGVTRGITNTENMTGMTITGNTFQNIGANAISIGLGATLAVPISGNTFSTVTGRHIGNYVTGLANFNLSTVLASNTFDKAVAVNDVSYTTIVQGIYSTITQAITEADAGATLTVAAGTYPEHVTINKAGLTLNGTGANINGSNTGIVVTITANNVVFDGFQVQNSGLTASDAGICLQGVTGCMIRNNTVINNFAGIALVGTTTSTVQYNFIGDNYFGIYLGIEALPSTGNVINDNNINNSIKIALGGGSYSGDGIYGDKNCHGNTFTINYIHNNGKDGIYFWKSFSNVVTGNTISNNTGSGIELMGSNNNDISENFINSNAEGIKVRVSSWPEGAYPSSPNSINDNRIVNNTTFALQVETQVPSVNATCNFYGSGVTTYVTSKISGPATYLPWLIDGSDSDADADNGFQPEPGKCIGNGAPFITVLTPNRGENWLRGTTQLITWDHNLTSNVKIDLYLADGVTFVSNIAMSISGTSYGWTIPGTTAGGTYKVRICNTSNPSVTYDFSNYAFTISTSLPGAAINVTAPSGNPNIIRNSHYNIQWTKTNVPENVKIELYNPSSGYSTLTANVSGLAWDWWVPFDLPVASGYKIRVSSTNDSGVKDEETFSVALSMGGTVTLITPPIATATYPRNSTMTIAWNKLFTENVKIELWNPGTSAYETLAWSVSGTTWAWWIPSYITPANGYKIKVSSVLDPLINSENDFNIAASGG